jgi:hypothetical protein
MSFDPVQNDQKRSCLVVVTPSPVLGSGKVGAWPRTTTMRPGSQTTGVMR